LKDEALVTEILQAVVAAVDVPVTLKIRTGWDRDNKNGLTVAKIAEQAGIQRWRCMAAPRRSVHR
jgi:tRNA-dihydrouridine synthase B